MNSRTCSFDLVGWIKSNQERNLPYTYVPSSSLHFHIFPIRIHIYISFSVIIFLSQEGQIRFSLLCPSLSATPWNIRCYSLIFTQRVILRLIWFLSASVPLTSLRLRNFSKKIISLFSFSVHLEDTLRNQYFCVWP